MEFRKINSLAMVINGGAVEFISVITFIILGYLLITDRITVGMATIGFMYANKFIDPMYRTNQCIGQVKSTRDISRKLLEFIQCDSNQDDDKLKEIPIDNNFYIEVNNVTKCMKDFKINYKKLRFNYPPKYLIEGENGIGKTVLLKLILKFYSPDEGEIFYSNNRINKNNITDNIFYSPQENIMFEGSYIDNISISGSYDTKNLSKYEEMFQSEMIEKIRNISNVDVLSGGEKQVIGLLRALCSEKKILILDEPFSAINSLLINRFIRKMKSLDRLVIIVAHNVDDKKLKEIGKIKERHMPLFCGSTTNSVGS